MNRTRLLVTALLIFLFASCAPTAAPAPTFVPSPAPTPAPTATSVPHASEIRFALIGNVTPVNVWALFDAKGYSYNNYAVMSGYWSRLYQLSIPDRSFETMAASGMPSLFVQEGNLYAATVPLRSDLKWTDGTPFTADDVAFTVNTAVSFQLGFDWHDFYNPDFMDHAEAVDAHTVKFYFKKQPNVGVWQYGALQGPIVQKAYWESKVSASAALLPPNTLLPQIASLTAQAADMQSKINTVNANIAILSTTSSGYIQGITDIKSLQANLNQTNTALAKAQSQYDSAMDAARQSLYALDNTNEPTLGDWMPAGQQNGAWINKVNPAHPFNTPKFDNVTYRIYASEDDAMKAIQNNDIDSILAQSGLSPYGLMVNIPLLSRKTNASYRVGFLVFNLERPELADPVFRQAFSCTLDPSYNMATVGFDNIPIKLGSFVLPGQKYWFNPSVQLPCANENDRASVVDKAVQTFETAGYSWDQIPQYGVFGTGLKLPNGEKFPALNLLVSNVSTDPVNDPLRLGYFYNDASDQIINIAETFGVPISKEVVSSEDLHFAVFSSHQYDMALLEYNVSEYPGYLCDWFKDGNPFGYHSDRLMSACEALNSTSDLTTAQSDVYEIQSILAQDLPFIPLYSGITCDAYRNIKYPFDSVLGGLSGVYGAPSLAIPAP